MIQAALGIITTLGKVGGKFIKDADKQMEYAFKLQQMGHEFMLAMLNTKTYPWIDALVKLAYASESIIKGLFRPLVSAGLFIYGILNPDVLKELHELGAAGDAGIFGMMGAFPAWMASRHQEKKRKKKPIIEDSFDDEEW